MIKEIVLNGKRIEYDLQRKDVKNINLRIKADRTIFLSANQRVSEQIIEEFIESKSEYILKALAHYEELAKYAPKPKQYVDGETFRILGHDRRLKVFAGKKNKVESDESYIILTIKDPNDLVLKKKIVDMVDFNLQRHDSILVRCYLSQVSKVWCRISDDSVQKYGISLGKLPAKTRSFNIQLCFGRSTYIVYRICCCA